MDKHSDFIIMDSGRYFTVENVKARDFDNYHTHINKKLAVSKKEKKGKSVCDMLIDFIVKKRVPNSPYLRESALRIARDEKYCQKVQNKIDKDRDRQRFFNQNMGIR